MHTGTEPTQAGAILLDLLRAMVQKPSLVVLHVEETVGTRELTVICDDDDVRRLVGSGGATISALAVVAKALAFGSGKTVMMRRVNPLRGTRGNPHTMTLNTSVDWDKEGYGKVSAILRRVVEACYGQSCEISEVTRQEETRSSQLDVWITAAPDGEWGKRVAGALNVIFATVGNQFSRRLHVRIIERALLGGDGAGSPGAGGALGVPRPVSHSSRALASG